MQTPQPEPAFLDLEGRPMRYEPWPRTGVRDGAGSPRRRLGSLPERLVSGSAARETLLAFESRGGDGEELAALLQAHAPPGFAVGRETLLEPGRSYNPEFWLYFTCFAKKLLRDPWFRFRAAPGAQLSRDHRVHERGPIRGRPWGLGPDGAGIRGLGMHNIALPLRFVAEELGGDPEELLRWLNALVGPEYAITTDFLRTKIDSLRGSYEYVCAFLSLAEAYVGSSGLFEEAFGRYIGDSRLANSAGMLAAPPGKAFEAFARYRRSLSDAYEDRLERRAFSIRLEVRLKDLEYVAAMEDYCLGALEMALGIHAGATRAALAAAFGRPLKLRSAEARYGGPEDARLSLSFLRGFDQGAARAAATGGAAGAAAGLLAALAAPAEGAIALLVAALGLGGAILGRERAARARAERRLGEGGAAFERQSAQLRGAHEELLRERDGLEENVRERTAELEEANRRLSELDAAKTAFFANISHELRTPLTLIAAPLDAIVDGRYGERIPKDAQPILLARKSAGRLGRLADGLLEFLRLDAGAVEPRPVALELRAFAAAILEEFRPAAEARGLSLEFAPGGPVPALADHALLETIALNLLSNALKFSPEDGRILVVAEAVEDGARLYVRDEGPGVDPERRARIFERYAAAAEQTRADYSGFGIGLPFSRDLARLMGGELALEDAVERGASFVLSLPAPAEGEGCGKGLATEATGSFGLQKTRRTAEVLASSFAPPGAAPYGARGGNEDEDAAKPRILIVDDDRDMLGFLQSSLAMRFRVEAAASGEEALRALEAACAAGDPPRAVVADVMMPGMDGFAFRESATRLRGFDATPFIFLSARADERSRLRGLGVGAVDYLGKPFSAEELEAKLCSLIGFAERERTRIKDRLIQAVDGLMPELGPRRESGEDAAPEDASPCLLDGLTERERAIAGLLARGLSDKEIAAGLGLSTRTVSNYVSAMLRKTASSGRTALAMLVAKESGASRR